MAEWTFPTVAVSHNGRRQADKLKLDREIYRDLRTRHLFAVDRDSNGVVTGAGFVSACCTAAVTYSDVVLCCKKCWHRVDPSLDTLIDLPSIHQA